MYTRENVYCKFCINTEPKKSNPRLEAPSFVTSCIFFRVYILTIAAEQKLLISRLLLHLRIRFSIMYPLVTISDNHGLICINQAAYYIISHPNSSCHRGKSIYCVVIRRDMNWACCGRLIT